MKQGKAMGKRWKNRREERDRLEKDHREKQPGRGEENAKGISEGDLCVVCTQIVGFVVKAPKCTQMRLRTY